MKYLIYSSAKPSSLLKKAAAVITTAGLIALGLMFSAILIPVILAVIAMAWGYLWWKTRELRRQMKQMQQRMQDFPPSGMEAPGQAYRAGKGFDGVIIEGEAHRVDDSGNRIGQ